MVAVLLADGFETAEALIPVDILRRAGVEVVLAGVGSIEVVSSHRVPVRADQTLEELNSAELEMLVLPGGGVGVENLGKSEAVRALILKMSEEGKLIGAICAAPVLLAELGILEGKRAVCFPSMTDELVKYGARLQADERVTHDRNIITAQAAGSSFDFGFKLVAMLLGWQASEKVRKNMYYPELAVALT